MTKTEAKKHYYCVWVPTGSIWAWLPQDGGSSLLPQQYLIARATGQDFLAKRSKNARKALEYLQMAERPGQFSCRENRWTTGSAVFEAFEGPLPVDNVISYGDSIA